jgi:hypothetical protein
MLKRIQKPVFEILEEKTIFPTNDFEMSLCFIIQNE